MTPRRTLQHSEVTVSSAVIWAPTALCGVATLQILAAKAVALTVNAVSREMLIVPATRNVAQA